MSKSFEEFENQSHARVIATFEAMLETLENASVADINDKIDELREQWDAVREVVDEVVDTAFDAGKEEGAEEAHG